VTSYCMVLLLHNSAHYKWPSLLNIRQCFSDLRCRQTDNTRTDNTEYK